MKNNWEEWQQIIEKDWKCVFVTTAVILDMYFIYENRINMFSFKWNNITWISVQIKMLYKKCCFLNESINVLGKVFF